MTPDAFFLPVAGGRRFCLFHQPDAGVAARGAVVYVHPFAEEMNKSRRAVALQARALASSGYAVLQIDLHGCGESTGDFGDASWEGWVADVRAACDWLQARCEADLWLWGLRTGCLLASEAAALIDRPSKLLLWQPVLSGKQYLNQFLRLRLAGEMSGGGSAALMDELRRQLAQGATVEIAGYALSPALADGLAKAELSLSPQSQRIEWMEISGRPGGELSPVASAKIAEWNLAGHAARARPIFGPAFWQTAEISECPPLLDASLQAMA